MLWVMKKKNNKVSTTEQNKIWKITLKTKIKASLMSVLPAAFPCFTISISINCRHWPNPKELLIFLLLDKFEDIHPVGRDGKREASRVFLCVLSLWKGMHVCAGLCWCLFHTRDAAQASSIHPPWKLTSSQTDLSIFITRNLWVMPGKLFSLCTSHPTRTAWSALAGAWLLSRDVRGFSLTCPESSLICLPGTWQCWRMLFASGLWHTVM